MSKIAKEAFANRNYQLAAELFERCLREKTNQLHHNQQQQHQQPQQLLTSSAIDLYFFYGDSLAHSGRLYDAFDIYAHITNQLGDTIPIERLKHLCTSLIDSVSCSQNIVNRGYHPQSTSTATSDITTIPSTVTTAGSAQIATQTVTGVGLQIPTYTRSYPRRSSVDPLLCPICDDILRCPVTATCGHTFCRECCVGVSQCYLCGVRFPPAAATYTHNGTHNYHNSGLFNQTGSHHQHQIQQQHDGVNDVNGNQSIVGLKPDVLVRRLIDKWWAPELRARQLNDDTIRFLDTNSLDDALKCCNESLEKSSNNYKGLLLRSEVLYRLNHFQSSLADADNALKSRPTSVKAYYRQALALAGLGRNEDALISLCLAACFDRTFSCISSVSFKNEVCRNLQRLFVPSSNRSNLLATSLSSAPYSVVMSRRRSRRKLMIQIAQNVGTSDCDEANSSCGEDDHFFRNSTRRYSRRMSSIVSDCSAPRPNPRLRTLLDRINQEVQKVRRIESSPFTVHVNPSQIDVSDFDCVLCCRTLWRPVVTPCGHTYCWVCLDRCMDYSPSCPLCMSPLVEQYRTSYRGGASTPVPFSLAKKSVTRFLEVAMKRFIPEWYDKRHRQEVELEPSVPVFICTTAFPHVPCPLFVYEPRYRLMVRRAIESGERQFGIVQPHTGKSRYSDVGTMLDIRDCVLLGDGCSILSTIGCRRFRILTRDEKDGYETAKVEYIYDEPISEMEAHIVGDMHRSVLMKAIKWYESLAEHLKEEILRSMGPMPKVEDNWETIADGPAWAWWIIAILPLNQQLKVNILATTSLKKRLMAIEKTLDFITGKLQRSQQSCVVVQCEGLPACQAVDCCQRTATTTVSSSEPTETTPESAEFML